MRKQYAVILFLVFLIPVRITAQGKWKLVAPYPPRFYASAAAEVGNKIIFWCADYKVYSTDDLGKSFSKYILSNAPPNTAVSGYPESMAFADSLHGTIVTTNAEYRTTDGGSSWQMVSPLNLWINENMVCYGSSGVGWKFGGGGAYKTTDTGATWKFFSAPFESRGIYSCAAALGSDKVWVLKSSYNQSYDAGAIWYSADAGKSWSKLNTGFNPDSLFQLNYSDFKIDSSGIGLASGRIYMPAGDSGFAFVQRTSDFGKTWSLYKLPDIILNNLTEINDSTWISFGNNYRDNTIHQIRTTDAGKTWSVSGPMLQYLAYNFCYSSTYSKRGDLVFASTVGGLFISKDKGLTYSKLSSGRDFVIVNLAVDNNPPDPTNQIVAALSNTHSYLLSTDGGSSWESMEFPYTLLSNFSHIGISGGTIYLVPDQRTLYKSTDSGNSWINLNVPTGGGIRALNILNKDTLFMEGYPYTIYSFDGGSSWHKSPFPVDKWLNQSQITSGGNISAVGGFYDSTGTKGIIYHSSDWGNDWRIIQTPGEMKFVKFSDKNLGTAVGNYYVYNTTDGGETWKQQLKSSDFHTYYSAVDFRDSLYGLLRVSDNFFQTRDGGKSWTNSGLTSPINGDLDKLKFGDNGNIYIVGYGTFSMYSAGDNSGKGNSAATDDTVTNLTGVFLRNYPNPFNPVTKIEYNIPDNTFVTIKIYDILGNEVSTLVNQFMTKGRHAVYFNGKNLSSGVYISALKTAGYYKTRKLLLLK